MRFYPIRLVSSQPKKSQGPVTLLEVTHLACLRSLSRSQVGLCGPRALGHVFGKRFAAQGYGPQTGCISAKLTLQEPRQTGQSPSSGARSTRRGLRVGVVDSFEGSFVENTKRRKRGGFIGLSFCLLNISAQLKVSNYTVSRHLLIEINFCAHNLLLLLCSQY